MNICPEPQPAERFFLRKRLQAISGQHISFMQRAVGHPNLLPRKQVVPYLQNYSRVGESAPVKLSNCGTGNFPARRLSGQQKAEQGYHL